MDLSPKTPQQSIFPFFKKTRSPTKRFEIATYILHKNKTVFSKTVIPSYSGFFGPFDTTTFLDCAGPSECIYSYIHLEHADMGLKIDAPSHLYSLGKMFDRLPAPKSTPTFTRTFEKKLDKNKKNQNGALHKDGLGSSNKDDIMDCEAPDIEFELEFDSQPVPQWVLIALDKL